MSLAAQTDRALEQLRVPDASSRARILLDRNELAGAFGDIGTDLPLLIGMILASGAPGGQIFLVFGGLQILSALLYGLPMPIQPLKMVAALVIAQGLSTPIIYGAGFSIGVFMLILTLTGLLEKTARLVPKPVVRGIQLGLGLKLGILALGHYIPAAGETGLLLAGTGVVVIVLLMNNRRWPPALFVIGLGVVYAFGFRSATEPAWGLTESGMVGPAIPPLSAIFHGFLLLALPQIPLSLGNSVLATDQTIRDLFPRRRVTVRRIGMTYSLMNLLAPILQGFPVCHGSGGIAGHYAFGGRTGGSVLIYGMLYVVGGLVLVCGGSSWFWLFPLPILGVLLLFEGLALMRLSRDLLAVPIELMLAIAVAVAAVTLPYGFLVSLIFGTIAYRILYRAECRASKNGSKTL